MASELGQPCSMRGAGWKTLFFYLIRLTLPKLAKSLGNLINSSVNAARLLLSPLLIDFFVGIFKGMFSEYSN